VNDDFLHRLREPPPAAFAARLRARLEAQVMVRRFRRRQITLYSLLVCLLGSTAVALVVPSVRQITSAAIRQVLPQSPRIAAPVEQPRTLLRYVDRTAREQFQVAMQGQPSSPRNAPLAPFVNTQQITRASQPTPQPATYVAGGNFNRPSAVAEPRALSQIKLVGAANTAATLETAFAEAEQRDIRAVYETSGNDRAFASVCREDTDIALATRMISSAELEVCRRFGIELSVLPTAIEALAVVTHPDNKWTDALSRADLKILFDPALVPGSLAWNQLDREWPALPVEVLAPRAGAGLSGAFNDLVFGNSDLQQRRASGVEPVNDAPRLLQRLQRSFNGLTYVPYPSYLEIQKMPAFPVPKLVRIVNADGLAVPPTREFIADGSYELARPLLMFVKRKARRTAGVDAFVQLALGTAEQRLARSVYLPLTQAETNLALRILSAGGLSALPIEDITPFTAGEILLRQLPEGKREAARARLLEPPKKPLKE
jgi:phosphate transport system substrate-binding protein